MKSSFVAKLLGLLKDSPSKDVVKDLKKRDERIRKARALKDNHSEEGWR